MLQINLSYYNIVMIEVLLYQSESYHIISYRIIVHLLVGGIPTPLKNMLVAARQLGLLLLLFPTEWKVIKFMFQTTNQIS